MLASCFILSFSHQGPVEKTVMMVGKGITYDTGGADIKAGGNIAYIFFNSNSTFYSNSRTLDVLNRSIFTPNSNFFFVGIMAGMSRDKCGAADVAGFLKIISILQPKNVKVT